jgi:hypothetical protein
LVPLVEARHDDLAGVLGQLARSVGCYVSLEPNNHQRPDSYGAHHDDEGFDKHADLLILKHDRRLYVDVSVTRPTNKSNLQQAMIAWTPLHSTKRRASEKHARYAEIAAINGYETVAFTIETYGGLAHESCQLLRTLASFAPSELGGEAEFLAHAHRMISICLQRGNARIDQTLMHRLHVEDVRRSHSSKLAA